MMPPDKPFDFAQGKPGGVNYGPKTQIMIRSFNNTGINKNFYFLLEGRSMVC